MATSMDFPPIAKKKNYGESSFNPTPNLDSSFVYIPVPGPQGERGQKGEKGEKGDPGNQGERGEKGLAGKDGKNGKDGIDGKSNFGTSGQQIGWAIYENKVLDPIRLGIKNGDSGWVSFWSDSLGSKTNELFLPENCVSLWNAELRKFNFRPLKIGAIVDIRYDLELTTFNNNTEVSVRTYIDENQNNPIHLMGCLKYQYTYDLSIHQRTYIENDEIRMKGATPQIRADYDSYLIVKSINISVS